MGDPAALGPDPRRAEAREGELRAAAMSAGAGGSTTSGSEACAKGDLLARVAGEFLDAAAELFFFFPFVVIVGDSTMGAAEAGSSQGCCSPVNAAGFSSNKAGATTVVLVSPTTDVKGSSNIDLGAPALSPNIDLEALSPNADLGVPNIDLEVSPNADRGVPKMDLCPSPEGVKDMDPAGGSSSAGGGAPKMAVESAAVESKGDLSRSKRGDERA